MQIDAGKFLLICAFMEIFEGIQPQMYAFYPIDVEICFQ